MQYIAKIGSTLAIATIALLGEQSLAQNICGANAENLRQKYSCTGSTWTNDECHDLALACGEYETVAANLASETKGLTLNQYYWQGMAYYGLMNRTRSTGLKCEYFTQARRSLSYFLKTSLYVYNGRDLEHKYDKPDPNRVYRVTKVVEELAQVKGCAEDGMTLNEIQMMSQSLAENTVRDAFLRPTALQKELMQKIFDKIQEVVTKASSIETNLTLKDVAADTMRSYMEVSILQDWAGNGTDSGIGAAKITPDHKLQADTTLAQKTYTTISDPLYQRAVALADALNRAFGGCDEAHLPPDTTLVQWNAMARKDQELLCRNVAAVKYGNASDFQKRSAREQIGIATLLLQLTQGNNEQLLGMFRSFNDTTSRINGVAPIRPTVDAVTKSWLKSGTKRIGLNTVCQEADEAAVDFWFCPKLSN
ncbi:MAG TPA: hypothetical protein VE954_03415 [Oligoflexus sp.]|uniref:hypothetical protein n=1 Tax=Oligoflexus sp. TaxID=1971216 RepID=UPI002D495A9F|nr:hypothetical protein [Oligoflexus sp.]HYX32136.1 hypothetical protein [Oligoflexus sp.]